MTDREAMQQALEALEDACGGRCNAEYNPCWQRNVADALRERLAQPEQEPVAYATKEDFHRELERRLKHIREEMKIKSVTMRCKDFDIALPIIDTDFGRVLVGQVSIPPQRKPLTDEEIARACVPLGWAILSFTEVARAIEAAHGIKGEV